MQPEIDPNTGAFAFLTQAEQIQNLTAAGLTLRRTKKQQREITNGALRFTETTLKSTKIAVTQTAGTTSILAFKEQ